MGAHLDRELRRRNKNKKHNKVGIVMSEFKRGSLRSSSGAKVRKRSQALAIGLSEAGLSRNR